MIILVTGGRDYKDVAFVHRKLDKILRREYLSHVIHGNATGADAIADAWAKSHGVQTVACDANWNMFKKKAGWIRNVAMAELKPNLVVAFPGGRGTNSMVEIAKRHRIPVKDYRNA